MGIYIREYNSLNIYIYKKYIFRRYKALEQYIALKLKYCFKSMILVLKEKKEKRSKKERKEAKERKKSFLCEKE